MTTTSVATFPSPVQTALLEPNGRVVVGMDDDAVSVDALRFAAREAAYRGGDVVAVHAWHYPAATWGYPMVWPQEASPREYILTELRKTIAGVQAERLLAGEPGIAIAAEVVEGIGEFALHAAAEHAGLLVLGTRHHNRFLGSVSQACINHPVCPIVLVPPALQPK